jgi:thiamine biosynthesis lipoprotein
MHRQQWYLFGTLVDVTLGGVSLAEPIPTFSALSAELQRRNRDWHPWQPGMMGDINDAIAENEGIEIDEHMAYMIGHSQAIHRASDGLFNPAIGKVIRLWGFHGGDSVNWKMPQAEAIERVITARPSPLDLRVEDGRLCSSNREVQLDFGGYAKGYAIDLGRRLLAARGIGHALINAGGDLVTLGDAPDGNPWRVAIRHPQRGGRIAWMEASGDEAVFTSGNYERYRENGGRRYPHIIDPRTGRPVRGVASATVVHTDAALADAAATALVVAGPGRWRDVADALGVDRAMVVDEQGRVALTPAMRGRVHLDA